MHKSAKLMRKKFQICGFSTSEFVHIRRTSSVCLPAGPRPVGYRQDIFAQEMDSSIVCTFVQTVQLRGCTGTSVWFSKVKLHCTRYCCTNVPLHMKQRCVSRKKHRSRLKRMINPEMSACRLLKSCKWYFHEPLCVYIDVGCQKFHTLVNSNIGLDVINSVKTFARGA